MMHLEQQQQFDEAFKTIVCVKAYGRAILAISEAFIGVVKPVRRKKAVAKSMKFCSMALQFLGRLLINQNLLTNQNDNDEDALLFPANVAESMKFFFY